MQINAICGGSMQGWNQMRCTLVYRPILTAAQTGPTSRSSGLQANRRSKRLPIRSPRPAFGKLTARLAMFRTR